MHLSIFLRVRYETFSSGERVRETERAREREELVSWGNERVELSHNRRFHIITQNTETRTIVEKKDKKRHRDGRERATG